MKFTETVAPVPQKIDTTYNEKNQWLDSLKDKNGWIEEATWLAKDKEDDTKDKYLQIKNIKYTDTEGKETPLGADTSKIEDAGTYSVTVAMKGIRWEDKTTGDKTFTIKVNQKPVGELSPKIDYGKEDDGVTQKKYYSGTATSGFPAISLPADWEIDGTLKWDDKQTLGDATEYNWTFTPDDKNYAVKTGTSPITVTKVAIESIGATYTGTGEVFTSTKPADLLDDMTLTKTYNNSAEPVTAAASEFEIVESELTAGKNVKITVKHKDSKKTCEVTIPEVLAVVPKSLEVTHNGNTVYTSTSLDDLKKMLTVKEKNNDGTDGETLTVEQFTLPEDFSLTSGTVTVNVTHKHSEDITVTGKVDITVTIAGVSKVTVTSTLPEGVTLWEGAAADTIQQYLTVTVTFKDSKNTTRVLDYEKDFFTVNIVGNADNELTADKSGYCNYTVTYGDVTSLPQKIAVSTVLVTELTPTYVQGGTVYSSADEEALLKAGSLTVGAVYNNGDEAALSSDEYELTIPANFSSKNNVVTVTWKKGDVTITETFTVEVTDVDISGMTATYTAPDGKNPNANNALNDLKKGLEVEVSYNNGDKKTLKENEYELEADDGVLQESGKLSAGTHTITVKYGDDTTATFSVTVDKADFDMSGVTFEDLIVTYDEAKHSIYVGGVELPDWITVVYTGNEVAEVGTHTVVAKFTHENPNYNTIEDMTAKLIIDDAVVTEIKAELSEKNYTTANTLDDLKAKLKVTAVYSNGTTAEIEDYELDFTGLRDGGKFKFGYQSLTVKYGEFTAVENNIMVSREKVALPTFKGGLKYTGVEFKPKATDFNGYDETLMTFVVDKTVSGLTVGSYKAVFALNDYENYEWATATTLKKAVFAVMYDEMVLNANEAAVDWNISKAVLTATKTEGGLPEFKSESFIGAFADVVAIKYYKDEACTEEVAADELAKETTYYVKAELLDTENFDLDASAAQYTVKSFTYTTPAKELTGFEKVLATVKKNWLWIVIAAVALILLILIIALAARAAKKRRIREEQRLEKEERKEEERRQREEERRREEREERMARMSQQQAMPQMMMPQMMPQMMQQQMPQSAPQAAPQAAQPVAAGGASSNEIAELKAEMAAMKAEQAAKEMAALRAEVAAKALTDQQIAQSKLETQFATLMAKLGGEQVASGGVTLQALTELIRTEVRNAMADQKAAAQPATAAPESAASAAAQVPPDAVMTTVTTTKIDTTKKPAQNAQAQPAPAARTVVRNVVAPMPVDDGRVFDVGGFYKPADPATDMGFTDEDKSE